MTQYNHDFYADQSPGSTQSAEIVLPLVTDLLSPTSVVDVGCGVGTWLKVAQHMGIADVIGIDGAYARGVGLQIDDACFVAADLASAVPDLGRRFDLAMSLEVAEHLPPERSDSFVADLCSFADVVLFSAGVPTQLGTDHINLQPQSAWIRRFGDCGYRTFDIVRPHVWSNDHVEVFYRQNAFVHVNTARADLIAIAEQASVALPMITDAIHPQLVAFWERRATRPVSTVQGARLTWSAASDAVRRRLRR